MQPVESHVVQQFECAVIDGNNYTNSNFFLVENFLKDKWSDVCQLLQLSQKQEQIIYYLNKKVNKMKLSRSWI